MNSEVPSLLNLLGAFLFALIIFVAAWWARFFRLPPKTHVHRHQVTLLQMLGAFVFYLALAFLVLPLISLVIGFITSGDLLGIKKLSKYSLSWLQVTSLGLIFICLLAYCGWIKRETAAAIFWGEGGEKTSKRFFKTAMMGVVALIVSYPFVLFMSALAKWLSFSFWGEFEIEQVAVKQLKATLGHPFLFATMIFIVVFLVPFMEELLFRGFLQSWLKKYWGRWGAIFATALIFALVHFAPSQGFGNFQLIISLFVLSFFLCFIYEREQTLWAPMALHTTFNACSVLMIIFE